VTVGINNERHTRVKRIVIIAVGVLIVSAATQAMAQDTKPWQRQGSRAGEEIFGPDRSKMVWVPAGEFMMGAADGAAEERPVHRVRISKGFWLSKCEMTVSQWLHYCKVAKVLLGAEIITPLDHPMSGVNWSDVQAYCRFYGLSLLSEAQWEWAARGPEGRQYPWGNQWDATRCSNNDNRAPEEFTFPVGSFPQGASWCGALDMAGNLAEWCADWYGESYYAASPAVDPTGPTTGTERVQRGGYCWGDATNCRSTTRSSDDPANADGSGCLRACYVP
jgi:formylglycine-generating enzyme required for sulfatase activity